MYLSKSKYCKAVQCNKILWLDKYKSEVANPVDNSSVLDNGTKVGQLAKELFGKYLDVTFSENLSDMINETKEFLKNDICNITEASFDYNGNFCSVDILKKNKNKYEIYEVKSSTEISDIYLDDISYQYYVLNGLGLKVTKTCIVHINSKYVRHGDLELDKLFNIVDVTDIVLSKQEEVNNKIDEINKYMDNKKEEDRDIDFYCFKPYECPYFKYCSSNLEEHNVFDIRGMSTKKKFELYKKGIYKYTDLLDEKINDKYLEQIDFELNDREDKIIIKNIKEFLNTISYPLYFLDFETFQESIPSYDDISPYEQIPFQYSLHILDSKDSELKHTEFLAESNIDPRRDLALKLVNDIPFNVCVLAYNMSFEKNVIKKLAYLYPELSEHLMSIYNNMKDLMIPFKNRDYYTKNMYGSYSIKYVLPALFPNDESLDYHNLDMVHNGSEASNTYMTLTNYSKKEQEIIRKNMLKYCYLDTYAMVKVLSKLYEVVENDKK